MSEIGSPTWIETCNERLASLQVSPSEMPTSLIVGLRLKSIAGDTQFSLILQNGLPTLKLGDNPDSTVVITLDKRLAEELHEGTRAVSEAIASGSVKISGVTNDLTSSSNELSLLSRALTAMMKDA